MMERKRKSEEGRTEAPTRLNRKTRCTFRRKDDDKRNLDTSGTTESPPQNSDMDESKVKVEVPDIVKEELDTSGTTESLQISDMGEAKVKVEEDVKVEMDSELEPPGVASDQEFSSAFSNEVPVPDMDNSEVRKMSMRDFKEENHAEHHGGVISYAIKEPCYFTNREPEPEKDLDAIPSSSKTYTCKAKVPKFQKTEMTGRDQKPEKGLPASSPSPNPTMCGLKEQCSESSNGKPTTTESECENFAVTGEAENNTGQGNSDVISHSVYFWKEKATEMRTKNFELEKKTWELEADLAYWKGKAKELERNSIEVEQAESVELAGSQSQSAAANCPLNTLQSTSSGISGSSEKAGSSPACLSPIPSMDNSSDATGEKTRNMSSSVIKEGDEMEVDEISSISEYSDCVVDMAEDHDDELNSSQVIGTGEEERPYSENSFSSLRSATIPEVEVTSCGPKPGKDLQITASCSASSIGKLSITECESLAPAGRLCNNKTKSNEGKGNAHDSSHVKTPLLDKNYEKIMLRVPHIIICQPEKNPVIKEYSKDSYDDNVNPLLDENIMKHVFQYILCQPAKEDVLQDIKNFRQVCKPWRNSATRLYRQAAPVLKFGSKLPRYTVGNLKAFLEAMKESEMLPFQSYDITCSIKGNQKLMKDFLHICGPDMISVCFHLDGTYILKEDLNLEWKDSLAFDLPKLEKLVVYVKDHLASTANVDGCANASIYFTRYILNATHSLRTFKMKFELSEHGITPYRCNQKATEKIKNIEKTISRHIPKSVKILDLQMISTNRTFTYLVEKGLSMEEFAYNPYYALGGSESIHKLLINQSAHLKVLRISSHGYRWDTLKLDFPQLPNLETLKLSDINQYTIIPFSFAETFPNLIFLDVEQWKGKASFDRFLKWAEKTAPSVKKIHLPSRVKMDLFVNKIAKYFPNITELRVEKEVPPYSSVKAKASNILEEVFTHLRNLEVLQITIPENIEKSLDSVFSGISEEDCTRICLERKFDKVNLEWLKRKKASLLNMKKLQKLVLKNKSPICRMGSKVTTTLTDFSVHFVFLKMAALNELELSSQFFRKSEITDDYLQRLRAKLDLKLGSD